MYITRGSIPDGVMNENSGSGSTRASPRTTNADDGPFLKKPKIEPPDNDGDDVRQVSQKTKVDAPHIIINLVD